MRSPATRLPGAGGAPEIAAHAKQTFVMLKASRRSFVEHLDFRTTARFGAGGPRRGVITDFGILVPHPDTHELQLDRPVRRRDHRRSARRRRLAARGRGHGGPGTVATAHELDTLRALHARTARPTRSLSRSPVS